METNKRESTIEEQLAWFEQYLHEGNGRGRAQSPPTVYLGRAGCFCVSTARDASGKELPVILFCCMPHEDILVSRLPPYPDLMDSMRKTTDRKR